MSGGISAGVTLEVSDQPLSTIIGHRKEVRQKLKEIESKLAAVEEEYEKAEKTFVQGKLKHLGDAAKAAFEGYEQCWQKQQEGDTADLLDEENLSQFRSDESHAKKLIAKIDRLIADKEEKPIETFAEVRNKCRELDDVHRAMKDIMTKYEDEGELNFGGSKPDEEQAKMKLVNLGAQCNEILKELRGWRRRQGKNAFGVHFVATKERMGEEVMHTINHHVPAVPLDSSYEVVGSVASGAAETETSNQSQTPHVEEQGGSRTGEAMSSLEISRDSLPTSSQPNEPAVPRRQDHVYAAVEAPQEQEAPTTRQSDKSCSKCKKHFRAPALVRRHEAICSADTGYCKRDHLHEPLNMEMRSFKHAQQYLINNQYDAEFIKDKPKPVGDKLYQYWRCSRAGKSDFKGKEGPHRTKKVGKCHAHIVIKGDEDGANIWGCTTHTHPNEAFAKRVPEVKRQEIVNLLQLHVKRHEIWEHYCQKQKGQKDILLEDIRRIENKYLRPETQRTDRDNIQEALRSTSVRAWNLDKVGPGWTKDKFEDEAVKAKWIKSDVPIIVHISERQRKWFAKNPRTLIAGTLLCQANKMKFQCSLNYWNLDCPLVESAKMTTGLHWWSRTWVGLTHIC